MFMIASFFCAMTTFTALSELWSILGDQGELFVRAQREQIERESLSYLDTIAYADGASVRTVAEAKDFLPINVSSASHRVVAIILSGLRYDAFEQQGDGDGAALARWHARLPADASVLCKVQAEVPSLSTPNWMAILMGIRPEVHGLLGNRGPAEQPYSSIFSVASQLGVTGTLIATPWMVDAVRSALDPFTSDGSLSSSSVTFEDEFVDARVYDMRREDMFMRALNSSARLVIGQFSQIDHAGHSHGASFEAGAAYAAAINEKATFLDQVVQVLSNAESQRTTLVVLADHGHLARGGNGGNSKVEREVPLIAYHIGSPSSIGRDSDTMEVCTAGSHSLIDVAPTLSALLGVPVPRHSQGTFIEALFDVSESEPFDVGDSAASSATRGSIDTWQWKDLYHQRHAFTSSFLLHPDVGNRAVLDDLDTDPGTVALLDSASDEQAYKQLFTDVQAVLTGARREAVRASSIRNQFIATFVLILALALAVFAMQVCTPEMALLTVPPLQSCDMKSMSALHSQSTFLTPTPTHFVCSIRLSATRSPSSNLLDHGTSTKTHGLCCSLCC